MKGFVVAFMVSGLAVLFFARTDEDYRSVDDRVGYLAHFNFVCATVIGGEGKAGFCLPPKNNLPFPIVINIYGGGNGGVSQSPKGFSTFFRSGFSAASNKCRLAYPANFYSIGKTV